MGEISSAPVVIIANRPSRKFLIAGAAIIIIIILGLGGYLLYSNYLSPKAQALNQIDKIINMIKNPNQDLLQKYQVSASQIRTEQTIISCGGYIKGKVPNDEKQCTPDSLIGIKNTIKTGNITSAKNLILQLYPRIENPITGGPNGDNVTDLMPLEQAQKIDPEGQFGIFKSGRKLQGYNGSATKKDAAFETMKLWYLLAKKKSL